MVVRRRNGDDGDDTVLVDERYERRALRADLGGEARADAVRAGCVVHGEAGCLVDRAGDSRRLAREVEVNVPPPVEVAPVRPGEEAGCLPRVIGDERQGHEPDVEHSWYDVEERAGDAFDIRRPRQLAGDPAKAVQLTDPALEG